MLFNHSKSTGFPNLWRFNFRLNLARQKVSETVVEVHASELLSWVEEL